MVQISAHSVGVLALVQRGTLGVALCCIRIHWFHFRCEDVLPGTRSPVHVGKILIAVLY